MSVRVYFTGTSFMNDGAKNKTWTFLIQIYIIQMVQLRNRPQNSVNWKQADRLSYSPDYKSWLTEQVRPFGGRLIFEHDLYSITPYILWLIEDYFLTKPENLALYDLYSETTYTRENTV